MLKLKDWITQHGKEGRAQLTAAIKEQFPRTGQGSISNWMNGVRIPDKVVAEIISRVTGIPLGDLSYRHVHLASTPPKEGSETREALHG